jgi:hypothetical protein
VTNISVTADHELTKEHVDFGVSSIARNSFLDLIDLNSYLRCFYETEFFQFLLLFAPQYLADDLHQVADVESQRLLCSASTTELIVPVSAALSIYVQWRIVLSPLPHAPAWNSSQDRTFFKRSFPSSYYSTCLVVCSFYVSYFVASLAVPWVTARYPHILGPLSIDPSAADLLNPP